MDMDCAGTLLTLEHPCDCRGEGEEEYELIYHIIKLDKKTNITTTK